VSVYIQLFHGRSDPDATMEDWGETGPTLGPFEYVQITYLQTVRLGLPDGGDGWLTKVDDLLYYNGMFYGDLDIVSSKNDRDINTRKAEQFDEALARRPGDEKPSESEPKGFTCEDCGENRLIEDKSEDTSNYDAVCVYCTGERD
jgi:hypothetical protein